jgi:type II secretory pathway pseudopilin PulG
MTEVSNDRGRRERGELSGSPRPRLFQPAVLSGEGGWTMVEMLVGMVMLLVLLLASFPLVEGASNTEGRIQTAATSIGNARNFTDTVLRDVRPATSVISPAFGGTTSRLIINTYVRRTDCTSGVLSAPGADPVECRVIYDCSGPAANVSCTRQEANCKAPFAAAPAVTEVRGLQDPNVFDVQRRANLDVPDFISVDLSIPDPKSNSTNLIRLQDGSALRNLGLTSPSCR